MTLICIRAAVRLRHDSLQLRDARLSCLQPLARVRQLFCSGFQLRSGIRKALLRLCQLLFRCVQCCRSAAAIGFQLGEAGLCA